MPEPGSRAHNETVRKYLFEGAWGLRQEEFPEQVNTGQLEPVEARELLLRQLNALRRYLVSAKNVPEDVEIVKKLAAAPADTADVDTADEVEQAVEEWVAELQAAPDRDFPLVDE